MCDDMDYSSGDSMDSASYDADDFSSDASDVSDYSDVSDAADEVADFDDFEFGDVSDDVSDDVADDIDDFEFDDVSDDVSDDIADDIDDFEFDDVTDDVSNDIADDVNDGDIDDITDFVETDEGIDDNASEYDDEVSDFEELDIAALEQALRDHEVYDAPVTAEEFSDADDSDAEGGEQIVYTDEQIEDFASYENERSSNGYYELADEIRNDPDLTEEQKDFMISQLQSEMEAFETEEGTQETVADFDEIEDVSEPSETVEIEDEIIDITEVSEDGKYRQGLEEVSDYEEETELTDEDLDAVYEGLEEYDFNGVDVFEDTERLDSALESFTDENWEQLSLEEQKDKMEELADYVSEVTGLENPPTIEYYYNESDTDYGGFDSSTNTLQINEYKLYENDEAADTIAHELWHAMQYERACNPSTKTDRMYAANFRDYIRPEDDFVGYQSQLIESEARAFAQQIKDRLYSYGSNTRRM